MAVWQELNGHVSYQAYPENIIDLFTFGKGPRISAEKMDRYRVHFSTTIFEEYLFNSNSAVLSGRVIIFHDKLKCQCVN